MLVWSLFSIVFAMQIILIQLGSKEEAPLWAGLLKICLKVLYS